VDVTRPTLSSGTLTFSAVGATNITVSWQAASDDVTVASGLQYQLYQSTTSNLNTLDDTLQNGTAVGSLLTGTTTKTVSSLSPYTTYHFNVVVQDAAGNKAAYTQSHQLTQYYIYMFTAGPHSGDLRNGQANGRLGADSICNGVRASTYSHVCSQSSQTHAFLSMQEGTGDTFQTMPTNYEFSAEAVILDATHSYQISDNWTNLVDINKGPCSGANRSTCKAPGVAGTSTLQALLDTTGPFAWISPVYESEGSNIETCDNWTSAINDGSFIGGKADLASNNLYMSGGIMPCDGKINNVLVVDLLCVCW